MISYPSLLLALFATACAAAMEPMPGRAELRDCEATWDANSLTVRNGVIERRWSFANGLLRAESLRERIGGREWLTGPAAHAAPAPEYPVTEACTSLVIEARPGRDVCVEAEALRITVLAQYPNARLKTVVRLFPGTPAITTQLLIEAVAAASSSVSPDAGSPRRSEGVEKNPGPRDSQDGSLDLTDCLTINPIHRTLSWVDFMDDTDRHDNLVHVRTDLLTNPVATPQPWSTYRSNLIYLEDQQTGDGLVFVKEAPLPHARPVPAPWDLSRRNGLFSFHGLGAGTDASRAGYPQTVLAYRGGRAGRITALQQWQRAHRDFDPARDVRVWHSIWGDRNRDGKVSEVFMLAELDRMHVLGMDFIYYIDGWQAGASSNSVVAGGRWENQWAVPGYWEPHPTRFPRGLGPVAEKAKALGIKRGVWFNPDKTRDYENWRRDTDTLLKLQRDTGASWFKYDGVAFTTKLGEKNILAAMHRVVEESRGAAGISIDISAGVRTGYWAALAYGELFLENRYTDLHRYWPHTTVRNLWQLAQFVDPHRLRMEFLNPERNARLYPDDPLAPSHYGIDYLFASVMFASPMAWFEVSGLSEKSTAALGRIIAVHRSHWEAIKRGTVFPIGDEPSGFSWTGFQSHQTSSGTGFVVALRELHPAGTHELSLYQLTPGRYRFESLAGAGDSFDANVGADGRVNFTLPATLGYAFYRYSPLETHR